jgi:hypothetical protein
MLMFKVQAGRFIGEEATLLLLCRYGSTGTLLSIAKDCGRSITAISHVLMYAVCYIHTNFPHLVHERSFEAWTPQFAYICHCIPSETYPHPEFYRLHRWEALANMFDA